MRMSCRLTAFFSLSLYLTALVWFDAGTSGLILLAYGGMETKLVGYASYCMKTSLRIPSVERVRCELSLWGARAIGCEAYTSDFST